LGRSSRGTLPFPVADFVFPGIVLWMPRMLGL